LAKFSEKSNKPVSHVSEEAFDLLRAYQWPGNVRELERAIERAVALAGTQVIFPEDLPSEIQAPAQVSAQGVSATSLEEMEKIHILKVLNDVQYNKSKASDVLGIDRATLYRKAQRYGIDLRGK
jgi:two-component system NtrC family response regulator